MDAIYRNREIRWLFLSSLRQARLAGTTQSGGWLNHMMMRKLLSTQGYDLSDRELREAAIYLQDREIGCIQEERLGSQPPYVYRFRITARGIQALDGEVRIKGVGIYAGGRGAGEDGE